MNAKINYTHKELTHRSTAQLIAIYNRLFNTNIWDEMFNPFEARQEILMALFAEMRAQEVLTQQNASGYSVEPYKAMKITVDQDGMSVSWNSGIVKNNNIQVSAEQMALVRALREDGFTMKEVAALSGVPQITCFRILKGQYAIEITKWNAERKNKTVVGKWVFSTQRQQSGSSVEITRQNNEFWTNIGL